MAAGVYMMYLSRRTLRRDRVFRDRRHPLEEYDETKIYAKFRFTRTEIFEITDAIKDQIAYIASRKGCLTPVQQILLTLRFYATGTFQNAVGELIGVDQSTVSRTVKRVTNALLERVHEVVRMPTDEEAESSKRAFFRKAGFPKVFACIDGTQIPIQAPTREREHEYVNRKNFHSINVQVVCDADLLFLNVIARWPGSVHDAKILRLSSLFAAFEGNNKPVDGIILGDSAYMIRPWLMTPLRVAGTEKEQNYNRAHSTTRNTIERAVGVAKQRWHCLRCGLRLSPEKACKVITVCFMLHNVASRKQLNPPPPDSSDEEWEDSGSSSEDEDGNDDPCDGTDQVHNERARTEAGRAVRNTIINRNF